MVVDVVDRGPGGQTGELGGNVHGLVMVILIVNVFSTLRYQNQSLGPFEQDDDVARVRPAFPDAVHLLVRPCLDVDPPVRGPQ